MSLNLSSLCRLCMCEAKPLFALFNSNDNIAEKVTVLLPLLKLSENDGLPSKICESCLQNINVFYDFKIQCEISEETLRNYLVSQQLAFKSCWNHESLSGTKTKEEHQNEQLTKFAECKTEIDIVSVTICNVGCALTTAMEHIDVKCLAECLEQGLTEQDILDILFQETNAPQADGIYIVPPNPAVLTDEDSGDKDDGGIPDNLNPQQLRTEAEIRLTDTQVETESRNQITETETEISRKPGFVVH